MHPEVASGMHVAGTVALSTVNEACVQPGSAALLHLVRLPASLYSVPHFEHLVGDRPLLELLCKHMLRISVLLTQ